MCGFCEDIWNFRHLIKKHDWISKWNKITNNVEDNSSNISAKFYSIILSHFWEKVLKSETETETNMSEISNIFTETTHVNELLHDRNVPYMILQNIFSVVDCGLWWLTPLSTIFQSTQNLKKTSNDYSCIVPFQFSENNSLLIFP
jgi:hypothetical protein